MNGVYTDDNVRKAIMSETQSMKQEIHADEMVFEETNEHDCEGVLECKHCGAEMADIDDGFDGPIGDGPQ
jgi:hypothetical protein